MKCEAKERRGRAHYKIKEVNEIQTTKKKTVMMKERG